MPTYWMLLLELAWLSAALVVWYGAVVPAAAVGRLLRVPQLIEGLLRLAFAPAARLHDACIARGWA